MAEQGKILAGLTGHVQQKLVGNSQAIELFLVALLTKGHVLIEDDPGSGKTALSKAVSESLALEFKRIQCTPDLLPSDLTGINIYQPDTQNFKFIKGPLFTEILLADELNRATPRTQAALLEAMAESQITVDGTTSKLTDFFMVIATQNPLETAGTFPLPEAQLDRFLFQFSLDKLTIAQKENLLAVSLGQKAEESLQPYFSKEDLENMREEVRKVHIHPELLNYMVRLGNGVTQLEGVLTEISHRGLLALAKGCQAYAYLKGRDFVIPEDIKALAVPTFAHRLFYRNTLTTSAQKELAILQLLEKTSLPTETWKEG